MDEMERLQLDWIDRHGVQQKDREIQTQKDEKQAKSKEHKKSAVDWEIDLHECSVEEARAEVESAVHLMQAHGLKTLRIVHGGMNGQFGPLKKHIQRLLQTRLRGLVETWALEEFNAGATLVTLKK